MPGIGKYGSFPPIKPRINNDSRCLQSINSKHVDNMARVLRISRRFQLCRILFRAYRIFLLLGVLLLRGAHSDLGRIQQLMQGMSAGARA